MKRCSLSLLLRAMTVILVFAGGLSGAFADPVTVYSLAADKLLVSWPK